MNLKTTIKLSIKEILANKLRSILTMLGVIIGVFSIVVIVSLGQGLTNFINESLFKDIQTIRVHLFSDNQSKALSYDENMKFYKKLGVKWVSPEMESSNLVQYKKVKGHTSVKGVNDHYFQMVNAKLVEGRTICTVDVSRKVNSVVINNKARDKFFPNTNPVGQTISIKGIDYKVVGLVDSGETSLFNYVQEEVYIPITTFTRDINGNQISKISLGVGSREEVIPLSAEVEKALKKHYEQGLKEKDNNAEESRYNEDFYVFTPEKEIGEMNKVLRMLSIGLGGIAGISLLVGGIGIMNIMFVSVTERTKEIGIRKAIGAKRKTIVTQFLVEAAIVSGIGGIIGLVFAGIVGFAVGTLTPLKPEIQLHVMFLAVGFSGLIGIVFGIYPANKAAKLKPIDALRFE